MPNIEIDPNVTTIPLPAYKSYLAVLTQIATDNPTVTVFENAIGGIVWTRNQLGQYYGTLAGAFVVNKTIIPPFAYLGESADTSAMIPLYGSTPVSNAYQITRSSSDVIILGVYDSTTFDYVELSSLSTPSILIEIRVYP